MTSSVFHLVPRSELRAGLSGGTYAPARLPEDGFVHCSAGETVTCAVADDYFETLAAPLCVLEIDPSRLTAELRFEGAAPIDGTTGGHLDVASEFPHVYGPIDLVAVRGVGAMGRDGSRHRWPKRFAPLHESIPGEPVVLEPHDERWVARFDAERERLERIFGDACTAVHHAGSTSILGLAAKPIVDVVGVLTNVEVADERAEAMLKEGYIAKGEHGIAGRRHFWRYEEGRRSSNVHVFGSGHPEVERMLALRDHLRENSDDARRYEELKRELAARHPRDVDRYSEGKTTFIRSLLG